MAAGGSGDDLQRLGILLPGLTVAYGLYAPVPFQGVVAKEALFVAHHQRLAAIGRGILLELVQTAQAAFQEQAAAGPAHILVDLDGEVGSELVLLDETCGAVRLGDLVHLLVDIRSRGERHRGQVVGPEIAVVPIGSQEGVTGTLCRGRLFLGQTDGVLQAQHQRVGLSCRSTATGCKHH